MKVNFVGRTILALLMLGAVLSFFPSCEDMIHKSETTVKPPSKTTSASELTTENTSGTTVSDTNITDTGEILYQPAFSNESGYYAEEFWLEITSENTDDLIYYTLDGSDPKDSDTRILYDGSFLVGDRSGDKNVLSAISPLRISVYYTAETARIPETNVDKCTVVRACSQNGEKYTRTVTKTYIVGKSAENYHNLKVISIVTDSANLFSREKGIYVKGNIFNAWKELNPEAVPNGLTEANYNQRGREWEREAHIDVFETDGTFVLSQDCGIRTQGGWSRADYQKSFRLFARSEYGRGKFNYEFFDGLTGADGNIIDEFDKLVLRNGGNDANFTKLKDAFTQSLVCDRNFATQTGTPCVVFIDGEYWGLYTLQTDYEENFFSDTYGVDKDDILYVKNREVEIGSDEEIYEYNRLVYGIINSDLENDANYNAICETLDISSYIDYMATEIYINNIDWLNNNYGFWKTRTKSDESPYSDGKWRLCLFDTDMAMNLYGANSSLSTYDTLARVIRSDTELGRMFASFIKNEQFRKQFVTTMMDLANNNFEKTRALSILEQYKSLYLPELTRHFQRFPILAEYYKTWSSVENITTDTLIRTSYFLQTRADYIPTFLKENLALEGNAVSVTVRVNNADGGTVTLNTSQIDLTSGECHGKYFTDYPITLTAEAADGYVFSGWSGASTSRKASIQLSFDNAITLTANFRKK